MAEERVEAFLEMMQAERGSSKNTLMAYQHDLKEFLRYLNETHQQVLSVVDGQPGRG